MAARVPDAAHGPFDPEREYTDEERGTIEMQSRRMGDCFNSINAPMIKLPEPNTPENVAFDPRGPGDISVLGTTATVHMRNWRANFPNDQIMVLFTDEIATDPVGVMERVTQFLGIRAIDWTEKNLGRWVLGRTDTEGPKYCLYLIPHEEADDVREHEPLSPDFERLAKTAYLDEVCALERMENVNLTLWKNEGETCHSA